ncbi:MAG TPA: histidine--tRNA ligase [Steroidobacteraceae bacterium]|jgi:histidyl-tRNA synthetase|nr:histidine--tRNA ligase [Steroidobacteraceae bacterium]
MSKQLQAVRGMNDVLPAQIGAWQYLERELCGLLADYGYEEVRVPVVEHTELFQRSIGEHTDIVEKEMYTFKDTGGDSLTLRPEATAGIVRAVIANGLLRGARLKLWTCGPMFRHERPQQGRFRQFNQFSVEAIGFAGPDVDAELIALGARLWRRLGITRVRLLLNSLGSTASRQQYRSALQEYFQTHHAALDVDSRRRLEGNPLRILDSKAPAMQPLIQGAPLLSDYLDAPSHEHFSTLCATLEALKIPYTINPRLVRGLDYYTHTVFEWVTDALGAQDAICSGGRYDGLIGQLGGEATPAIGFALGVERVVDLIGQAGTAPAPQLPAVYIIASGAAASGVAMQVAEQLREAFPGQGVQMHLGAGNFKAQFRRADRSGACLAVILGDAELERGVVAVKPLRRESGQSECALAELAPRVRSMLEEESWTST